MVSECDSVIQYTQTLGITQQQIKVDGVGFLQSDDILHDDMDPEDKLCLPRVLWNTSGIEL